MSDSKVINLFPVPVMISSLGRKLTTEEKGFVERCADDVVTNELNLTSRDTYVLEKSEMKDLKQFFLEKVKEFVEITENPKYDHEYYITNSWLNFTRPGQGHHQHKHQNSFVTGVFYVNALPEHDCIEMIDSTIRFIQLENKGFNPYNSRVWDFKVASGELYLFRSDAVHRVPTTDANTKHTRISLSFNTFLRGHIGSPIHFTELNLK
jgi:uncharacterized protein (TIGR02466 family)